MRWLTKLGAAVTLTFGLGDDLPRGGPAKADCDRLQGTWSLVESTDDGVTLKPPSVVQKSRFTFKDNRFRIWQDTEKGRVHDSRGTFTLDPIKNPKTIDFELETTPIEPGTLLGIYKIDGDTLWICSGGIDSDLRPNKFSSLLNSKVSLRIYKRISRQPAGADEEH